MSLRTKTRFVFLFDIFEGLLSVEALLADVFRSNEDGNRDETFHWSLVEVRWRCRLSVLIRPFLTTGLERQTTESAEQGYLILCENLGDQEAYGWINVTKWKSDASYPTGLCCPREYKTRTNKVVRVFVLALLRSTF